MQMTTLSPLLTFKLASAPANLATWSKPEDTILYEGRQTTTGMTGQMSQSIFFAQRSIPLSENLKLTRTLTLTSGVFFQVQVQGQGQFQVLSQWYGGVLRWAKISLAHLSGCTHCYSVPLLTVQSTKQFHTAFHFHFGSQYSRISSSNHDQVIQLGLDLILVSISQTTNKNVWLEKSCRTVLN